MSQNTQESKVIVLAAGGTGGHVLPAVAVGQALRNKFSARVVFFGTGRDLEKEILLAHQFELVSVEVLPFVGKGIRGMLRCLLGLPTAFMKARKELGALAPRAVLGFGGFPSFVPIVAAWSKGIPCFIQEQNVQVGLANKALSLLAQKVFAVTGAKGFFRSRRVKHVSNPVRHQFLEVPDWKLPVGDEPLTVLVMGGSQGARALNDAFIELAPRLSQMGVRLIHQTGKADADRVENAYKEIPGLNYRAFGFTKDTATLLAESHVVVSRAGALTVAEVAATGRPGIYVPLPIA